MSEETKKQSTPWDDPNVKAALKSGRRPDEISLIDCPECGVAGYYNDGSNFTCKACGATFAVRADDEDPPDRPWIALDDVYRLDDSNFLDDGQGMP